MQEYDIQSEDTEETIEACRAKQLSDDNYELIECLTNGNAQCEYHIYFGFRCLCRHPKRQEIAEKTFAIN